MSPAAALSRRSEYSLSVSAASSAPAVTRTSGRDRGGVGGGRGLGVECHNPSLALCRTRCFIFFCRSSCGVEVKGWGRGDKGNHRNVFGVSRRSLRCKRDNEVWATNYRQRTMTRTVDNEQRNMDNETWTTNCGQRTVDNELCTANCVQRTVYSELCTANCVQRTVHSELCTANCVQQTTTTTPRHVKCLKQHRPPPIGTFAYTQRLPAWETTSGP